MGFENWASKPTGLVLSGGGGKGAYQIGAFKALREAGLNDLVTAVAGTSVGALNMCLFNYDDGLVGEDIWNHISPSQFVEPDLELLDGKEGLVSREGLTDIIEGYIDLNKIRNNPLDLYATVSEYDSEGRGKPKARYLKLNGKSDEEIKQILLITSAMPIIYEPIVVNGLVYRDGGAADNLPIKPLYDMGIRQFIVILLSKNTQVPTERFPGAEFLIIRPSKDLGDTVTGTLDFTAKGSKERMELGYLDASRTIRFYGDDNAPVEEIAQIELRQLENKLRVENAMSTADANMAKLNALIDRFE
ncbi:MAG: patatin-like phospholipase family protein [Alistipes sp.]|nr:patatin-like phospholipase family protein [Alistipes sp.]